MPINSKWILTLGILAMSPGLAMGKGPFGFSNPFGQSEKTAQTAAPNNQQVAEEIAAALSKARLTGYDINIEFQNGVATLTGMIQDSQQKMTAQQLVQSVAAVQKVDNRLELITPETGQTIQQTAFQAPTKPEAVVEQATYQAQPVVPGISPIQQVAGSQPAPVSNKAENQKVANSIAYALRDSGVSGYDIEISYKDGLATLNGSVQSPEQRQHIDNVVKQVSGVKNVSNQLQVMQAAPAAPPVTQTAFQPTLVPGEDVPQSAPADSPMPSVMPNPPMSPGMMAPGPVYGHPGPGPVNPVYNQPYLPKHAWPTYAAYPNYAGVSYPKQYSASAFPYIGPFYPYPQVPMGWRSSTLEWDDGQWQLKFSPQTDRWWWFLNPKNWD